MTPEDEARAADPVLDEIVAEWRLTPEEAEKHAAQIRGTFLYQRRVLARAVGGAKDATLGEIRRRLHRPDN